jgi:hypothetical protein
LSVPAVSLNEVIMRLERTSPSENPVIDVLVTDIEGVDLLIVLELFDLSIEPSIIRTEYVHADHAMLKDLISRGTDMGYVVTADALNILMFKP